VVSRASLTDELRAPTRFLLVSLLIGLVVASAAPMAGADVRLNDPDEGLPLDLQRVAVERHSRWRSPAPKLVFRINFRAHDWDLKPLVQIHLDTRRGPRPDLMIKILGNGLTTTDCFLSDVEGHRLEELMARTSTDSVGCKVKRSSLQSDGTPIRWRVVAMNRRHFVLGTEDRAPDDGCVPHV
jgi:hypothetical protein